MALLIAGASSSLEASGTWRTVDATTGASSLSGTVPDTVPAAADPFRTSVAWTGDSATVDGILLELSGRAASPSGTLRVEIWRTSGTPGAVAGVTVNVADLPLDPTWLLFTFSPVTLSAGDTIAIHLSTSAANQVTLTRNATAWNWNRALRTTTTPAGPAAGDTLMVVGEHTAAGALTARTVTVTTNSTTAYGALTVGDGGTLAYATGSGTAYNLRLAGDLQVLAGGAMTMGTVATPMPGTTTAALEFACTVDGEFGLRAGHGSSLIAQGAARSYDRAKLAAAAAAGATALTSDVGTGWVTGDEITIAQTSQGGATGESEKRTLTSASGTSLGVGALDYGHDGTSPTQAEIILLTRNVKIRSTSSSFMSRVLLEERSTVDLDWVECYFLGTDTAGIRGLEIHTAAGGAADVNKCSFHDFRGGGLYLAGDWNNVNITTCIAFNLAFFAGDGVHAERTAGSAWAITGNIFLQVNVSSVNGWLEDLGGTFSANTFVGGMDGLVLYDPTLSPGTFIGNRIHSASLDGLSLLGEIYNLQAGLVTAWRCGGYGVRFVGGVIDVRWDGLIAFGNGLGNIAAGGPAGAFSAGISFAAASLAGDATYPTAYGIDFAPEGNPVSAQGWTFSGSDLGLVAGSGGNQRTAHTVADVRAGPTGLLSFVDLLFVDSNLSSALEVSNQGSLSEASSIRLQKADRLTGHHRTYRGSGKIESETLTTKAGAMGARLTPSSGTRKLESEERRAVVAAGGLLTAKVWMRKTSAYAGAAPRLRLRANPAAGIAVDATIATMTAGADTWEEVGGPGPTVTEDAVLKYYVDCDGVSGDLYLDEWSIA